MNFIRNKLKIVEILDRMNTCPNPINCFTHYKNESNVIGQAYKNIFY